MQNNPGRGFYKSAFLLVGAVLAPIPSLALKDDRTKPIEVSSDSAERDEKMGITLYHGNVVIRQGSLLIEADTVTIKTRISPVTSREELEEIVTVGKPSHLQQRLETNNEIVDATSSTMRYEVNSDSISLMENALLQQGQRVIKGDRIVYDIAAQKVIAGGDQSNAATPGRVTVTLPPKSTPEKTQK